MATIIDDFQVFETDPEYFDLYIFAKIYEGDSYFKFYSYKFNKEQQKFINHVFLNTEIRVSNKLWSIQEEIIRFVAVSKNIPITPAEDIRQYHGFKSFNDNPSTNQYLSISQPYVENDNIRLFGRFTPNLIANTVNRQESLDRVNEYFDKKEAYDKLYEDFAKL